MNYSQFLEELSELRGQFEVQDIAWDGASLIRTRLDCGLDRCGHYRYCPIAALQTHKTGVHFSNDKTTLVDREIRQQIQTASDWAYNNPSTAAIRRDLLRVIGLKESAFTITKLTERYGLKGMACVVERL